MEYYSTIIRKEIQTVATTWMIFRDIALSELCQAKKDKHCIIPLI
jgi:hypothetical protein